MGYLAVELLSFNQLLMVYLHELMATLLIGGALLLFISLYYVRKLTKEIPRGSNRNLWKLLGGLILFFISGYFGFYLLKLGQSYTRSEILVPVIFGSGAVFVLLVCMLAYRTTCELKRVFVLEQETVTDPLLGIFNRRHLDRRLQEEMVRCERYKLMLAVLLVDIDHFKKVNDTWGHQVGDIVLKHVSRIFVDTLRQTDMVARFGGEEFVLLLPHTPEAESYRLAERLRKIVEKTPCVLIQDGKQLEIPITISIGIACAFPGGDSSLDLLERADKAMYRAKQEGRNRVVRCPGYDPDEVVEGLA